MADSKSSKKLITILLIVIILLVGGGAGGYFFLIKGKAPAEGHAAVPPPPALPIFLELEPTTINLQPEVEGDDHVLYVAISLELETDDDRKNLFNYLPEVNTRILYLISSKTKTELKTLEGKLKLAEEMKTILTQPVHPQLPPNKIKNISFNKFILR
ncbi:flagellar basal body-associated protein FliL [Thorsellia kenyensis]|uniref:Flagellar protein FliL n=1 Tax=Thorsellia kenyensis TaxID=1549888 RepID=A0ABV6CAN8_9GAMM